MNFCFKRGARIGAWDWKSCQGRWITTERLTIALYIGLVWWHSLHPPVKLSFLLTMLPCSGTGRWCWSTSVPVVPLGQMSYVLLLNFFTGFSRMQHFALLLPSPKCLWMLLKSLTQLITDMVVYQLVCVMNPCLLCITLLIYEDLQGSSNWRSEEKPRSKIAYSRSQPDNLVVFFITQEAFRLRNRTPSS